MGFYDDRILPRVINLTCGAKALFPIRQWACEGLHGEVVELGFGSGLNVGAYPDTVTRVSAIEPSDGGWHLAEDRIKESTIPITRAGLDGQRLPFDDNTFDSALSTFTLCTIPDLQAALHEVRRVVKDDGTLHFLEHGLAPDEKVRRWQHRLDPLEQRIAGGCRLTRDIPRELTDAGLSITANKRFYGAWPKSFGALNVGVAQIQ
ncbi:class I SAM-dependent methyltransferase [Gordonia sp. CPCC 205515]|uniref:class I SAM-dependent methyltransferase n=1 Tax=Gordonia sp. CPCC 205515 TaxID=3140791 RepID=UPI003AF35A2F